SELSWTKKNVAPSKLLSIGEEVSVMILEIDRDKRRISLGLKQTQSNPWVAFADSHFVGEVIEGEIKNITEFGVFIAITPDIDGMAHMSDLSWNKPSEEAVKDFSRGKSVKAKILEIDPEKERVSLGIKQLERDVVAESFGSVRKGEIATAHVTETSPDGLYVDVNGMKGFIKTSEISRNRSEQKPERFAVGEKVDAKIIGIDSVSRRLTLSIKAHEIDEERKIVKEYGSADSGALLGDILGGAIERAKFKK
ncbi:MAG: S1 RNA-binding domain-containing protein, partial [Rickettsiales bacterium]|nr:S1 RNA-binding domain-containing protein [Rickettsiales bacterium]